MTEIQKTIDRISKEAAQEIAIAIHRAVRRTVVAVKSNSLASEPGVRKMVRAPIAPPPALRSRRAPGDESAIDCISREIALCIPTRGRPEAVLRAAATSVLDFVRACPGLRTEQITSRARVLTKGEVRSVLDYFRDAGLIRSRGRTRGVTWFLHRVP